MRGGRYTYSPERAPNISRGARAPQPNPRAECVTRGAAGGLIGEIEVRVGFLVVGRVTRRWEDAGGIGPERQGG